jgi:hypothetical protein
MDPFWARMRRSHRLALYVVILLLWTFLTLSGSMIMFHNWSPPSIHSAVRGEVHAHPPLTTLVDTTILGPASTEPIESLSPAALRSLQRMLRLSPRRLNHVQRAALTADLKASLDRLNRLAARNRSVDAAMQ